MTVMVDLTVSVTVTGSPQSEAPEEAAALLAPPAPEPEPEPEPAPVFWAMTVTVSVVVELEVVVVVGSSEAAAWLPPAPAVPEPAGAVTVCTLVRVWVKRTVVVMTELPEVKVRTVDEALLAGSTGKPEEGDEETPVLTGKGGAAPLPAPRGLEAAGSVPSGAEGAASLGEPMPVLRGTVADSAEEAPASILLAEGS